MPLTYSEQYSTARIQPGYSETPVTSQALLGIQHPKIKDKPYLREARWLMDRSENTVNLAAVGMGIGHSEVLSCHLNLLGRLKVPPGGGAKAYCRAVHYLSGPETSSPSLLPEWDLCLQIHH
jgi:hypothetical protein